MSWEKVKLEDCCISISDGDHMPPPKSKTGIPFITISNINSTNQIDFSDTMFVPQEYYDNVADKRKAKAGDILYSVVGSYGIPVLIKEDTPFVFQRHIAILRPNEKVYYRFLYYSMISREFYMEAEAVAVGAAQKTIGLAPLRKLKISCPKIETQKCIADILSAYDNLIENNQKQIKLLEEAAQRTYKEWFVDFHFPGNENVKIVNGVPKGWNYGLITEIIQLLNGYAFKSSTFNKHGKFGIVTIKNVYDAEFVDSGMNAIIDIPTKMPNHCVLKDGDILLSLTGNVGRVCMVFGNHFLLNQRVAKIESNYYSFSYCMFRNKNFFDTMNNLANGVAQQNLSPIRVGNLRILIPDEDVLMAFENAIAPLLSNILLLHKQSKKLMEARNRLLPKLMNGEMEV